MEKEPPLSHITGKGGGFFPGFSMGGKNSFPPATGGKGIFLLFSITGRPTFSLRRRGGVAFSFSSSAGGTLKGFLLFW